MKNAFLAIASLALLQLGLVLNILYLRNRHKIFVGAPDDPENPLFRARLAHANAAEFAPMLCILMLCLELYGNQVTFLPVVYVGTVVCRIAHAIGLVSFSPSRPNFFRALGMGGTLLCFLALTVSLISQAGPGLVR